MKAHATAGTTPVVKLELPVLTNRWLGVEGGWTVTLICIMNSRVDAWEQQLPADTKQRLDRERNSAFSSLYKFPNVYLAPPLPYGTRTTNLLAQFASWNLLQIEPMLKAAVAAGGSDNWCASGTC
jgi:hypothetical protein